MAETPVVQDSQLCKSWHQLRLFVSYLCFSTCNRSETYFINSKKKLDNGEVFLVSLGVRIVKFWLYDTKSLIRRLFVRDVLWTAQKITLS